MVPVRHLPLLQLALRNPNQITSRRIVVAMAVVEPSKIVGSNFALLGANIPHPNATSRQAFDDNLAFAKKELGRWWNSIAWVNDELDELSASAFSNTNPPLMCAMSYLLNDDNAEILNKALLDYLKAHVKWSCTVIRDKGDYFALVGHLAMAVARITDTLLPHARDNIEALVLLKTVGTTAKGSFELDTVLRFSGLEPYWTESDLAKEEEEEKVIEDRYYAWEAEKDTAAKAT